MLFKFRNEDPGHCRVYYTGDNPRNPSKPFLYCIQNDGRGSEDAFTFYTCSRDGEPDHEIRMPMTHNIDKLVYPRSNKA